MDTDTKRRGNNYHWRAGMLKQIVRTTANCVAVTLILVLAQLAFAGPIARDQNPSLTGAVRNASGHAVAGAYIKIKNEDLGLVLMVVSQANGRYNTPSLLPGKYTVQ